VRVAARLRRGLSTDVELVKARYGEFRVLVDGETVAHGGDPPNLSGGWVGFRPAGRPAGAVRSGHKMKGRASLSPGDRKNFEQAYLLSRRCFGNTGSVVDVRGNIDS